MGSLGKVVLHVLNSRFMAHGTPFVSEKHCHPHAYHHFNNVVKENKPPKDIWTFRKFSWTRIMSGTNIEVCIGKYVYTFSCLGHTLIMMNHWVGAWQYYIVPHTIHHHTRKQCAVLVHFNQSNFGVKFQNKKKEGRKGRVTSRIRITSWCFCWMNEICIHMW